jgi:hypothetical protein
MAPSRVTGTFTRECILCAEGRRYLTAEKHNPKCGHTLVTKPRTVAPYRDRVDGTRDNVTFQKLVTR